MVKLFFLVIYLFVGFAASAQLPPVQRIALRMESQYENNRLKYGANKIMPPEYEKQIITALSYFPELANTKITFTLVKGSSGVISTRPEWLSVFKNSSRRAYVVFIGDSSVKHTPRFMFRNSPVDGQVGIIGHELTHIVYFSRRNTFGLLKTGIAHVSTCYMDRFENKTDSVCIERGLGYQLIDWNIYLRKAFGVADPENGPDPFFTDTTRERYMSPARIRQVMSKSKMYTTVHD